MLRDPSKTKSAGSAGSLSDTESSREQSLTTLREGYALMRRRTYDDRTVDTFERKDFETVEKCYAPEVVVRPSHDCLQQSCESNLKMLRGGMSRLKKMR